MRHEASEVSRLAGTRTLKRDLTISTSFKQEERGIGREESGVSGLDQLYTLQQGQDLSRLRALPVHIAAKR